MFIVTNEQQCAECSDITPNKNSSIREFNNMEFTYAAVY